MSQFLGEVVGTKMQRTVKVCVNSLQLHPVILKVNIFFVKNMEYV